MNSKDHQEGHLQDILDSRLEKLSRIHQLGSDSFPYNYQISHDSARLLEDFSRLEEQQEEVSLAGRLIALRRMGKASFAHLLDSSGRLQLFVQRDEVGEDKYALFKLLDIGDLIGVKGVAFRTRAGEESLLVKELQLLTKNLYPLPIVKEKDGRKFDAFTDKEQRYRQRYLDLIVNPEVRDTFRRRSQIVQYMREFLLERDYLEVETPVLQPLYGGAAARPFVTHHNALDTQLYLRIANELYLKRLIVGGFERVFEFARDFRNEGIDRYHNPEFTQLELYAAWQDYTYTMDLFEQMVAQLAERLHGTTRIMKQGIEIDLAPGWPRVPMLELIRQHTGEELSGKSETELQAIATRLGLELEPASSAANIIDEIFGHFVEPQLIQPTFVTDYPVAMSPLARRHRTAEGLVERFEVVVAGKEICNAFSELNDAQEQKARFQEQHTLI
ncbi:MAG: lysine--tRNA ligase, partial [Candidatus Delongbacteria bacterium]|nr:lysine--tRNA ligase [Candidatus Delongbacteria bacterium]